MGARHGPCPPAGGGAPRAGTAARAAAGRGGGGRGRGRNCGAGGSPGAGGRGGCSARRRRSSWGPRAASATPGHGRPCGAALPRRRVPCKPGRRGWRGERSSPGQVRGPGGAGALWSRSDPGRRGSCRCTGVSWGHAASPAGTPGGVGGGTGFPAEPASSDSAPKRGGQLFLSPARQGWGLAREGRWRRPGQRHSFHFPPAAGDGFQEFGSSAARMPPGGTRIATCNFFVGPVEKPRPERASWSQKRTRDWKCSLVAFTVKYSFGFGARVRGMLGRRRLGRDRWVHIISAQRVLVD